MTKKERKKMATISQRLREIADEIDRAAGTSSPGTVTGAPTPSNPSAPKSAPAKDAPSVPAQVSSLAASAMGQASKLTGPRVGELVALVDVMQRAKTDKDAHEAALSAIRFSQFLSEDHGVDVAALTPFLNQIRDLTGDGSETIIIGELEDVGTKDMTN